MRKDDQKDDPPDPGDPAAETALDPAAGGERSPDRRRLRAGAGRYLRARAADLFGDPGPPRAALDGFGRASAAIDLAIGPADAGGRGWLWLPAPVLRHRHGAEARVARAFFSTAAVAALVCGHRLWLADLAGAGASLGMAFTLAGFALRPAYRCHRLRARLAAPDGSGAAAPDPERAIALDPRAFLRRPALWWPRPLPEDPA